MQAVVYTRARAPFSMRNSCTLERPLPTARRAFPAAGSANLPASRARTPGVDLGRRVGQGAPKPLTGSSSSSRVARALSPRNSRREHSCAPLGRGAALGKLYVTKLAHGRQQAIVTNLDSASVTDSTSAARWQLIIFVRTTIF